MWQSYLPDSKLGYLLQLIRKESIHCMCGALLKTTVTAIWWTFKICSKSTIFCCAVVVGIWFCTNEQTTDNLNKYIISTCHGDLSILHLCCLHSDLLKFHLSICLKSPCWSFRCSRIDQYFGCFSINASCWYVDTNLTLLVSLADSISPLTFWIVLYYAQLKEPCCFHSI